MDDQLIQDILSQKGKPKKSVIYHRSLSKKYFIIEIQRFRDHPDIVSQSTKSMNKSNIDFGKQLYDPYQQQKDNDYDTKSRKSQQSKIIQNTLNSLRRARLNIGSSQSKLNADNLNKFEKLSQIKNETSNIQDQGQNNQLQIVPEDQKNEEISTNKCVLCDQEQEESDLKLAQKLIWYSKERGEQKKLLYQIKQKLISRQIKGDSIQLDPESIDFTNANQEIPLVCFKCQYEMILGNEGRSKAMRLFNIAQLEIQNSGHNTASLNTGKASKKLRDTFLYPIKNTKMHDLSPEMKELGILKGQFYDYKEQKQIELTNSKSSQKFLIGGENSSKFKQNVISIAREGKDILDLNDSIQNPEKKPRIWREEFADKIVKKFGSIPTEERQKKILKKLEKERQKYYTGQRIHQENQELLRDYHSKKNQMRRKNQSQMSKNQTVNPYDDQQSLATNEKSLNKSVNMQSTYNEQLSQRQIPFVLRINNSVNGKQKKIDRTFFRKLSAFGAYANASFNAGVFVHPSQQFL